MTRRRVFFNHSITVLVVALAAAVACPWSVASSTSQQQTTLRRGTNAPRRTTGAVATEAKAYGHRHVDVAKIAALVRRETSLTAPLRPPWNDDSVTRIDCDVLVPGDGEPIVGGATIIFEGGGDTHHGTILYVGPSSGKGADLYTNVTARYQVPVVMPGMFDVHTHFGGEGTPPSGNDFPPFSEGYDPARLINFQMAVRMMEEALMAGVTSVREVGGPFGQALKYLVDNDVVQGPSIYYAKRALGMTGGHTDEQMKPLLQVRDNLLMDYFGALCDGPSECTKKTREQIRSQASVIKVMTSGGVLSEFDQPTDVELSDEEVRAITNEAARGGRVVAAHAHGAGGIESAINNGVRTIEHGSYMTPELAKAAKEKGMRYHPTCTITQQFNESTCPSTLDPRQWAKGQALLIPHSHAVRNAMNAGLVIATGTDCPFETCALVGTEVHLLTEYYGMTPIDAVKAATANGPLSLGETFAPNTGVLRAGMDADIIALLASPLDDPSVLAYPGNITHVWKLGRLFKSSTSSGSKSSGHDMSA